MKWNMLHVLFHAHRQYATYMLMNMEYLRIARLVVSVFLKMIVTVKLIMDLTIFCLRIHAFRTLMTKIALCLFYTLDMKN